MGSSIAKNTHQKVLIYSPQRTRAIKNICLFKTKNSSFKRESQFIAFSIIDKLYEKNFFSQQQALQSHLRDVEYACAAILLASKFNDSKLIKVKDVISCFKDFSVTSQQIVEAESIVLQAIDYTIPIQTAYSSLSSKIYMETCRTSRPQLLKALKFLTLCVQEIPTIVLDTQFGQQIFEYLWNSKGTKRIKEFYSFIREKERHKKRLNLQSPQQICK